MAIQLRLAVWLAIQLRLAVRLAIQLRLAVRLAIQLQHKMAALLLLEEAGFLKNGFGQEMLPH